MVDTQRGETKEKSKSSQMKYTYQDMPDKSKEGIRKETSRGLGTIAAFFLRTYGLPFDYFKTETNKLNDARKVLFYMNFRNKHPDLFNQK